MNMDVGEEELGNLGLDFPHASGAKSALETKYLRPVMASDVHHKCDLESPRGRVS